MRKLAGVGSPALESVIFEGPMKDENDSGSFKHGVYNESITTGRHLRQGEAASFISIVGK
jgi:hypothetical protein